MHITKESCTCYAIALASTDLLYVVGCRIHVYIGLYDCFNNIAIFDKLDFLITQLGWSVQIVNKKIVQMSN